MYSVSIYCWSGVWRHYFLIRKSVWDGYIIPHKSDSSPTNKIFDCLWKLKGGEPNSKTLAESTIRAVGKRLRLQMVKKLAN